MKKQSSMSRRDLLGASIAWPLTALALPVATAAPACGVTPAQTTGPFYPIYDQVDKDVDLTRLTGHGDAAEGEVIRVRGQVLDGTCNPIAGALVDLWQADANGRYGHPADPNPARRDANFQGWGQTVTDAEGRFSFRTIKPAAYPMEFLEDGSADERVGYRTPHIHFRVSRRGYDELATQMYFAGEKLNASDIVLRRVPEAERSKVVISPSKAGASEPPVFTFDIALGRV